MFTHKSARETRADFVLKLPLTTRSRFWIAPTAFFAALVVAWALRNSESAAAWLWSISLFVVGMPHGAYDIAAMRRQTSPARWSHVLRRFSTYSVVLIACVALFAIAPLAAVTAFLLLTMHHFGISDALLTQGRARLRWFEHAMGTSHGMVVIAAPFVLQPAAACEPFLQLASVWHSSSDVPQDTIVYIATALLVVGIAGSIVQLVVLWSTNRRQHLFEELCILGIACAAAWLVQPLMAIALYFVVIHASGHCLRAVVPNKPVFVPSIANFVRVHVESLPLLIPSILLVAALSLWMPGDWPQASALAFLLFCVVATLPHHLLWLQFFSPRGEPDFSATQS